MHQRYLDWPDVPRYIDSHSEDSHYMFTVLDLFVCDIHFLSML